jgi:hypothetical protein
VERLSYLLTFVIHYGMFGFYTLIRYNDQDVPCEGVTAYSGDQQCHCGGVLF